MKLLVVDDSAIMRKVILRELLALGFDPEMVLQAEDGREAVKMCVTETFDLVLMDWNMPNMLGIDALRTIRASGLTTPVIMVTTEGEKANVVQAIQAGANNYLAKPFKPADLKTKIEQVIKLPTPRSVFADSADSEAPQVPNTPEPKVFVDLQSGRIKQAF